VIGYIMENTITKFEIIGLHGTRDIIIHIKNNCLILVGENGTGKSTVAYTFYYILTKQWRRLANYTFKEFILFNNNNDHVSISSEDIRVYSIHHMSKKNHAHPFVF
jgi:ABC-type dipeptide/oligopeptide/nickel transport system ATPase component